MLNIVSRAHRKTIGMCVLLAITLFLTSPSYATDWFSLPDSYELPDGINPEGITRKGFSNEFFVGSIANGGIYQFDALTGIGDYVVEGGQGRVAIGMDYDARTGLLYVAGGPTGMIYVYRPDTGELVTELAAGPADAATFVNDVKVTKDAVYVTDSFRPVFYSIKLGRYGKLKAKAKVKTVELTGDYEFIGDAGTFNANGIEAHFVGHYFIIVHSTLGKLYAVNAANGHAREIEVDQTLTNGDGLFLFADKLYVVQNADNQIALVQLDWGWYSGEVVDVLTNDGLDVPTTIAPFGFNLLAVNARFGTPDATEFSVQRVSLIDQ